MDSTLPLLFALSFGFAHAFEADHLLAVSNIVSKRDSVWLAVKDGIAWGLGHTSTIFSIGFLIIVGKIAITDQTFHYFEAAVGVVLISLGIYRLRYLWQSELGRHSHFHLEDLAFWKKQPGKPLRHIPLRPAGFTHPINALALRFSPKSGNHRLAYVVGLIHGLAGSGALVLLVMSQIRSASVAMAYLFVFGVGSIGGMLLASGLFSLPFSKKWSANPALQTGLTLLSSLLCVGYGAHVIYANLIG